MSVVVVILRAHIVRGQISGNAMIWDRIAMMSYDHVILEAPVSRMGGQTER